ncbi:hypothetical protein SRABI106_02656 [Rahnella aquatilis]|nr:hypothetical protein SRABI106_02656 [Rahnella aquatilis]
MAQQADGGGVNPFDFAMAHHQVEHADDSFRTAVKERAVPQINQIATQLEIFIERPWFFIRADGQNRFIEQLQ